MSDQRQRSKGDQNGKDYGPLLSESPQTVKDEGQMAHQSSGTVEKTHEATSREVTKGDGVPYDRGWAWMIVLGTFTNITIVTGYLRSTGIIFVELLRHFGAPASKTSLIFGIRSAVFSISGLYVMNAVVGRIGSRKTVIIGSFCVTLSLILSSIAGDLIVLICVQSILFGVGLAMTSSPGEVLVGAYFKRRRSLALAIGKCGGSVGSFAIPPLVVYLLQEYGLRGTLLVYGAICFHSLAAALLLRPTSFYKKLQHRRGREAIEVKEAELDVNGSVEGDNTGLTKCVVNHIRDDRQEVVQVNQRSGETSASSNIMTSPETSFDGVTACKAENKNSKTGKIRDLAGLAKSLPEIQVLHRGKEEFVSTSRKRTFSEPTKVDTAAQKQTRDLKKAGIIEKASESTIAKYISMPSLEFGSMPVIDLRDTMANYTVHEIPEKDAEEEESFIVGESRGRTTSDHKPRIQEGRVVQCCKSALSVLDFSLLRRPTFRMLLVYFAFSPVVNITTNLLPAVAIEKGVGKTEAALLLSITGGLDLVCRLGTGFIADSKKLHASTLIVIAFVVLSIMTQFVRFMTSFVHFLVLAVVHGLLGGVSNVLGAILIIDYTGLENMGKGIGFAQFVVGASMAGVYPLLGYIRDVTGSYDVPYHVIGCGILLAAGLLLLVRLVHRWETRHLTKRGQDTKAVVV